MESSNDRWMSLIERTGVTFESFLDREFSQRFYSEEFLNAICERRSEAHARIGKASGTAVLGATVIAFFDLLVGQISYSGVTINIAPELAAIVALFTASALLSAVYAFLDDQIIFRVLLKLGNRINIHNFPLLLIDKFAVNLWGDALTPRVFGPKSGGFQKFVVWLIAFVTLCSLFCLLAYPIVMVIGVFVETISGTSRLAAKFVASVALIVVVWAVLTTIAFSVKFRFAAADWYESTNKPTEDFARQMREKMAGEQSPTT